MYSFNVDIEFLLLEFGWRLSCHLFCINIVSQLFRIIIRNASEKYVKLNARTHGATLRATFVICVSTPQIVGRNVAEVKRASRP